MLIEEVFLFISAFEVLSFANSHHPHVRHVRIRKTSSAEMKGKTSSAKILDKTIWNPRPVIDLLSRAIINTELGGSFLLVLGPTFSTLLTNKSLLTNAVGIIENHRAAQKRRGTMQLYNCMQGNA